ncbi:hypothetical protein NI17_012795 [Thermobifida halotolerans]|uniref:Uncharacterized protein n=1 Tax=Thermobifida halotolerans TaxID=483545 RepID=A0A399G3A6_9ACTN|nr:DUF6167 family protein [Thermobifida halotolerans]UOE17780.1 hypothetical protein NI17_012795 [Thermobifida halotolerans]
MIGRTVYFVAGAVVGGYVVYRVNRAARAWTPGGIADRVEKQVTSYKEALREFNEDVADAVREHEEELLRRYAADPARREPPALPEN